MRRQIPDLFPNCSVMVFQPTNNLYLVDKQVTRRGLTATFSCHQVTYDPVDSELQIGPRCSIEDEMVPRWLPDEQGALRMELAPRNWRRPDWRRIPPEIIQAFQDVLDEAAKKRLGWFKDENIEGALRKARFYETMGPATSPSNPEIRGEPKVQIIKP